LAQGRVLVVNLGVEIGVALEIPEQTEI